MTSKSLRGLKARRPSRGEALAVAVGVVGTSVLTWLGPIIGAVLKAAILGVIGNRSDAGVLQAWDLWDSLGGWWTVSTVCLVILAAVIAYFAGRWSADAVSDESGETMEGLLDIDDSLLRLLPAVADPTLSERQLQRALARVIEEWLRDVVAAFGEHVNRAVVLVPRGDKPWLMPFAHYRMPGTTLKCCRFYIGEDGRNRDRVRLAGSVFLTGEQTIVRFDPVGKRYQPDDPRWTPLDSTGAVPSYRAIAAIPIRWDNERLGVLCLDSMNRDMFDSADTQELLATLGTRVATPLVIFRRMQRKQRAAESKLSLGSEAAILDSEEDWSDVDS